MKIKSRKKIILVIIFTIILISVTLLILEIKKDNNKTTTILANKIIYNNDEINEKIKYKIKIKNYDIESVQKEITFDTEEQAQQEYERYEIINEYERKNLNVQIKKKKLTIQMTEEQFKEDIEYDEKKNITYISSEGEQKEIMSQGEIINALVKQGYTIK
jgi:hypothetical protein